MTSLLSKIGINVGGKVQTVHVAPNTSPRNNIKKEPTAPSTALTIDTNSDSSTKKGLDADMDKPMSNSVQVKPTKTVNTMASPRFQPGIAPTIESPKSETAKLPEDGSIDGTGSGSMSGSGSIREGFSETKLAVNSTQKEKNEKSKVELSSSGSTSPEIKESAKKSNTGEAKGETNGDVSESEEDIEPVEVLLQFIPYYGQGDPSNDSIVRATLSGLSVEDIDSKDEFGNTLLLLACQYRCEDLVRIMLNKGADPNATNNSGACCLHFACYRESASYAVAKVLLQNGASPDVAETTFGCTPLHYCAGTGDIKFCKLLLSYGAQIVAKDYYNYTCVDYAREAGMADVATFLQQHYEKALASGTTKKTVGFVNPNAKDSTSTSTSTKDNANLSSKSTAAKAPIASGVSAGNSISSIGSGGSNNMAVDIANWESHVDPESGGKYYIHIKTGECLWENELQHRVNAYQQRAGSSLAPNGKQQPPSAMKADPKLAAEAAQMKLLIFLTKHDPSRIVEVDKLLEKYKGNETQMFTDLRVQYKLEEPSASSKSSGGSTPKLGEDALADERKKLRAEFDDELEEALAEERKIQKSEAKKQIQAALEDERKVRELEHRNAIDAAVLEERKAQRIEAQKQLDQALAEERRFQKNEAKQLLESAIEEERALLRSEAKRQVESAVDEERRVQKAEARRLIEVAVEEEYRIQKAEARKQIESAVEEERRILRIEARRQLEATLEEERKVHMTEAKRLIDEAVEEEKRFLMKKLENALEDEKKLSDKKMEAALEQERVALNRKLETELEERETLQKKLDVEIEEKGKLQRRLEQELLVKERQQKQLQNALEEERTVHKKDMEALITNINSSGTGQSHEGGDSNGLTEAINMKIEARVEEQRLLLKRRFDSAIEEKTLAHNRKLESVLEEEKQLFAKKMEALLEEERLAHNKRLDAAVEEERHMHAKRMEIAMEEQRIEYNKRLELALEEEKLSQNKRLQSSLSDEKTSMNMKLEAAVERERSTLTAKYEALLEEERYQNAQKIESKIEEERAALNKKMKYALEDERSVQNQRMSTLLEEQKYASEKHLEVVLEKERIAWEKSMEQALEEKRELYLKNLDTAIEEERAIQRKKTESLLEEERRLQKKQAEENLAAAMEAERIEGKKRVDAVSLEEEKRVQVKLMDTRLEEERKLLRQHYEKQQEKELLALTQKFEKKMDEEKASFRQLVSEKEGFISQLSSQIENLNRLSGSANNDVQSLMDQIEKLKVVAAESAKIAEAEIAALKTENSDSKSQNSTLQEELNYSLDKLKSLELTLTNLTAGHEERIANEKASAEARAQQQKERETQFSQQIKQLEAKSKNTEVRLKTELNQARQEWAKLEKQMKDEHEQVKKSKDSELEALRKELADRKEQFAKETSAAQLEIEDLRRSADESMQRCEGAVAALKATQDEIAEAKIVQKYNAQLHKDLQREQLARKKLHNEMEDLKGKIRVYVRIRPFSKTEKEKNCQEAVIKDGKMTVMVKGLGGVPDSKKFYDFDAVFSGSQTDGNSQEDIFKDTRHLMMSVVDGYNVCIFAYGQTGAGKSFTMIGAADIGNCLSEQGEFDNLAGITPRAVSELFRLLNERSAQVEFAVEVQMFQLYRDGLEDLLKEKTERKKKKKGEEEDDMKEKPTGLKITLAEHSPTGLVFIEGAEVLTATTPGEVMKIFARGSSRRTTASTQMNAESSRSHLICSLVVKLTNRRSGMQSIGKLTLVDLAGSERVDKSGAAGDVLKEAQSINKSLSALGDVIAALTSGQQHIPYRNHPLTMLMSDSIGGNAKTLMFVNTSPADYNSAESNSSLAFASRCKDVTNQVASAPGVQAAQVNALKKELAKLKKGGPSGGPNDSKLPRPT